MPAYASPSVRLVWEPLELAVPVPGPRVVAQRGAGEVVA